MRESSSILKKQNSTASFFEENGKSSFFKPVIQPKLTINQSNDPDNYRDEQEADAMADKVMRMPAPSTSNFFFESAISSIQSKCSHCEEEEKKAQRKENSSEEIIASPHTENYINSLSEGRALNEQERSFFEPRIGYNFSNVRLHTDSVAAKSAQSINALAYTTGSNIVFNEGQYAPNTDSGKRLLGHELIHVLQQGKDYQMIQRVPLCPGKRDSGEVTKSQSPDGILAVDTSFDPAKESLSVQDFGIDQDSMPTTITQSDDWRRMMSMILGDPATHVAVLGYSDCIGTEQNNQGLRDRRADAVVKGMPAEAQAKVGGLKGWWGSLTYLFPNDTAENRARNRMVLVALLRAWVDSCDSLPKAANIDQFIFLVSCLEKRLGLTNAADAPKTLSVLRQLYFGNAAWTAQANRNRIWDDIITSRPWAPGNDPTPKLGTKLFNALQASKDIKFDSNASATPIDISHLLTGLDAMMNPQNTTIRVGGSFYLQTNTLNHALATWAGDVASAAANYTICVNFLKFSATYDEFFKDLAGNADLEGDIDAYAAWAALNSAPGAPVPLQLNLPFSEVLMQYYRLKKTPGGQARATRFEIFANYYGANVKSRKMQDRLGIKQNIYPSVSEIAILLFGKQIKEVMQGNASSIGTCAGGKPPIQTGNPAPVDLGTLLGGVATASAEMTERFTVWLEQRL